MAARQADGAAPENGTTVGEYTVEVSGRRFEVRVRGHGVLPISFSWGMAQLNGRPLREVLDEADRKMYGHKGSRR